MSYFFALRPQLGPDGTPLRNAGLTTPRVGLTVGKVMGKAVDRNRIKRRMREAVRHNLPTLNAPVDVILHPRRSVIDLDFATLDREVAQVFRSIQKLVERQQAEGAKFSQTNANRVSTDQSSSEQLRGADPLPRTTEQPQR